MLASGLIAQARSHLQDESSVLQRWPDADLLDYLNDAQTELINLKPDALTGFITHTCSTVARQTPSGVAAVLGAIRNIGGDAITLTQRSYLDRYVPGWMEETGTAVRHVMIDPADEAVFWVWPVCDGVDIELEVSTEPTRLTAVGDTIEFQATWFPALVDYLVYRALASDIDSPTNNQLAASWFNNFVAKVGVRDQAEAKMKGIALANE